MADDDYDIDSGWKVLGHIHDWIRVADAKAAATLTASGVLAGIELKAMPSLHEAQDSPARFWVLVLSCVLAAVSALMCLVVLAPRVRAGHGHSAIFFSDIDGDYCKAKEYVPKFRQLLDRGGDELLCELGEQVWANAHVASRKFVRVGWAMRLLGAALLVAGAAVLLGRL